MALPRGVPKETGTDTVSKPEAESCEKWRGLNQSGSRGKSRQLTQRVRVMQRSRKSLN